MNNEIVYQQPQKKSKAQTLFSCVCSCLSWINKKKDQSISTNKYQLGIDSPKNLFTGQRKLLVLDLDETLVHSQFSKEQNYTFEIDVIVQNQLFKIFVTVRPGAEEFIEQLNEYYEIVLWTASLKEYADQVMDYIDPNRRAIARLYREDCTQLQIGLTKNLLKLGRDLKDIIIIDNSPISFCLNQENGFRIKDFIDDMEDQELDKLLHFFIWISQLPDIRPIQQHYEQFEKSPEEILNQRQIKQSTVYDFSDPKRVASLSRSLSLKKNKGFSAQIIRTLTLSKESDDENLDEEEIKQKLGLDTQTEWTLRKSEERVLEIEKESLTCK